MNEKVGVISLGCPKNLVDTEVMLGHLAARNYQIVARLEDASVVIVNTCGFIDKAKEESIDTILEMIELKKQGKIAKVVVAGCLVQRYGAEIAAEIPEIDILVGLDELETVAGRLREGESAGTPAPALPRGKARKLYGVRDPRLLASGGAYAYLKIAEGCNNPCTFCTIPQFRGNFRSRDMDSLVEEARGLRARGVSELILIAQDTTRYGEELGIADGLTTLVRRLLAETDFPWIRFHYAYPDTFSPTLVGLMAENPRFLAYVDIPFQHASAGILARMQRHGDGDSYRRLVGRIRATLPEAAVRTSMIVGFPGEGEAEFEELASFVEEMRFDHLGVFTYSHEEKTRAFRYPDDVPAEVKADRQARLTELQEGICEDRNRSRIGKTFTALVERVSPETEHLVEGRFSWQAPEVDGRLLINDTEIAFGQDGEIVLGKLARVEVTAAYAYDLVGRIVGTA